MEQYVIKGGNPLVGEVEIGGAKNAALAILSAAVMTDETVTIENVPNVRDTNVLLNAIEEIGARVERLDAHTVRINGSFIRDFNVDNEFIRKIRASYYLIGALLGKYKRAEVALPGGCNIGGRPIDCATTSMWWTWPAAMCAPSASWRPAAACSSATWAPARATACWKCSTPLKRPAASTYSRGSKKNHLIYFKSF